MKTFKEFLEVAGGFGYNQYFGNPFGKGGKQIHGNQPFMPTHALTRRADALMSPRRRQLLDDEEAGQKYQYYIILVRNIIADIDTSRLIGGQKDDVYKIVYSQGEMTRQGYGPEEQVKIQKDLQIFEWTKGYNHKELIQFLGSNNLDQIKQFKKGNLFDPNQYPNLVEREGYFVNIDHLSEVRDQLDHWISIQDMIERGFQFANDTVGNAIRQGASLDRITDSPSTTLR